MSTISPSTPQPTTPTDSGGDGGGGGGSSGGSSSSGGGNGGTSSTLYLFTFLATLFVLLLISSAIILRSFILRRRFRRRVEEALANGLFFDAPPPPGPPIRILGEKPKLHDAWVVPLAEAQQGQWEALMPVAAQIIKPRAAQAPSPPPTTPPAPPPPSRLARLLPFGSTRTQSIPAPSSPLPPSIPPRTDTRLAVSVLIAMPSPLHSHIQSPRGKGKDVSPSSTADGEMPDVVFGLAELPCEPRRRDAAPA